MVNKKWTPFSKHAKTGKELLIPGAAGSGPILCLPLNSFDSYYIQRIQEDCMDR